MTVIDDVEELPLRRVCDSCVPQLLTLSISSPESPNTTTVTVPPSNVSMDVSFENNAIPEVDDTFLIECPVCRTDLRAFGDEDLQAIHVATCLEGHGTSPSFSGGSRHLGMSRLEFPLRF